MKSILPITTAALLLAFLTFHLEGARRESLRRVSALESEARSDREEIERLRASILLLNPAHRVQTQQEEAAPSPFTQAPRSPTSDAARILTAWPENEGWFDLPKESVPNADFTENPLFSDGELNPDLALIFGMSAAEAFQVESTYKNFYQMVRELEQARLMPENEMRATSDGRQLVGRLPAFRQEVEPARRAFEASLGEVLGAQRLAYLREHLEHFYNTELDGLGQTPREFYVSTGEASPPMLTIYFLEDGRKTAHRVAFDLKHAYREWRYGHLFQWSAKLDAVGPSF